METLDEDGPGAAQVAAAGSADDPDTWDAMDSGQTFAADSDLPEDIVRTMTAAWAGAIEPGTPAGMTVKGNILSDREWGRSQETWVEPGTEDLSDAQLATVGDPPALSSPPAAPGGPSAPTADSDADGVEKTLISDEFAPAARDTQGETTQADLAAGGRQTDDERTLASQSDGDSFEKTLISDEHTPQQAGASGTQAGSVDSGMEQAAAESEDSFEATLISDSHSGPEHRETMESGTRGVPARKTSPAPDEPLPFVEDQTDLVIKLRAFRQQDGSGPTDAEYQINRVLGEGGMGVVFDAIQTSINRSVAVKMMKKPKQGKKLDQYAASRQKFLAEAVVTGDLDHPNIVPIYDVGRDDHNALFYSMKNVVGTPWLDVIRSRSVHENLDILMRVADAVAFAHARGVVHRDLKPENVMLGEFGEILVMDWGLALPTQKFRKGESVRRTSSMGGTPAYMAPEMATGPIDKIGSWSDIYLLGAILYEIVTGKPPHRGKNAMKCLMAAAKNEIEPTDKTGELMDIALKAMAMEPRQRYKTVQDFQSAVREYLSHTESVTLSTRAEDDLLRARQSQNYEDFQQSVYGFKEAFELWKGNKRAITGLAAARLAYAECALQKEDFDLGLSQLDTSDPKHAALHARLVAARAERDARVQRIKTMKRVGLVAGLLFLVTAGSLSAWALSERNRALVAEDDALDKQRQAEENYTLAEQRRVRAEEAEADALAQKKQAEDNFTLAEQRRVRAENAEAEALAQKKQAEDNFTLAEERRVRAENAEADALVQKKQAEDNFTLAEERRQEAERNYILAQEQRARAEAEEQRARYEAYIAKIGLSAAKVEENAFDSARKILADLPREQRNWEWGRLMHLCSQHDQTYETGARVEAVALAPDGRTFIAGGWDGTAALFNQATGERLAVLPHSDSGKVRAVAFSDDGKRVATAGDDSLIRVWNVDDLGENPQPAQTFSGHGGAVTSIDLADDGRLLVSGSEDQTARIWEIGSGREVRRLRGHYDPVWSVAFAPGAQRVVTASQDGTVRVWESHSGEWQPNQPGLKWWEQDVVVVNKPGPQVEGDGSAPAPFRGHNGPVFAAAFDPSGRYVATAGFDGRILVWDPAAVESDSFANVSLDADASSVESSLENAIQSRLEGHLRPVRSLRFSSDGRFLVSGGDDNAVKIWDVDTGKAVKTFRGHDNPVRSCAFDPEGNWVLSGSYDSRVKKWSMLNYEEYRELASIRDLPGRAFEGHADAVLGATFSPDGQSIVTASQDRTARTWDFFTSDQRQTLQEGHEFLTSDAALVNKGGKLKLLTAAVDNTVRVWDVLTAAEEAVLPGTGLSAALGVSPDGEWILTGSDQNADGQYAAQLWRWKADAATSRSSVAEAPIELQGHSSEVSAVAFSQDGGWIVTADSAGHCLLWQWDGSSARQVAELGADREFGKAHTSRVADVMFVGERVLTASFDSTVAVWDVASRREVSTLKHRDQNDRAEPVLSMAVTPDGRTVITSCEDRIVRVWDLASGRETGRLQPRGGAATLAANVERFMGRRMVVGDLAERSNLSAREIDEFLRNALRGSVRPEQAELDRLQNEFAGALGVSSEELLQPRINSVSVSADGQFVLTANSDDAIVQVWDLATRREIAGQKLPVTVWSAMFLPGQADQTDVLVVGGNGARLWNLDSGRERMSYTPNDEVASAAFSPDSRFIVTSSWDNSIRIWDAATGKSLARIVGHTSDVRSAVFSGDGSHVLTASKDGTVRLWAVDLEALLQPADEMELRKPVWTYPAEGTHGEAWQAAFSPDGALIIAGFEDGTARILDSRTGTLASELRQHTGDVLCVTFSPDGRRAITGSDDLSALVWDLSRLDQPRPTTRLQGHTAAVTSVGFSPDNERALTGSRDTTVKLWDVGLPVVAADAPVEAPRPGATVQGELEDKSEMLTLSRHQGEVTSVQFSPDGRFVLSGSKDGTAIVWLALDWTKDLEPEDQRAGAWRRRASDAVAAQQ